jgi:2-iminoacetate synthase
MSFARTLESLPIARLLDISLNSSLAAVRESTATQESSLEDFARLISPTATNLLEPLSLRSQQITRQRFGRVMRLFAPLYLSNECINKCSYCGFSRDNPILRVTLTVDDVRREAQALVDQGFRNLLLVSGEHPKFVSTNYLADCVQALREIVPSISLEVGPMPQNAYRSMVQAGADGLVVYQETYDRKVYAEMHTAGPKRNFEWRLETPERAYAAGFRRLGIGALFGLSDWRSDAICVAAHASYLLRNCWKAALTISLPRLRPCAGDFQPLTEMSARDLVQLVCAFRIAFPDVGLVLSTRETARLRDGLIPLGITLMSAGSHTEPGGYTGAGKEKLHHTERGRIVELADNGSGRSGDEEAVATEQFQVADYRSPKEIADVVQWFGYEPVWKDWDPALTTAN